MHDHPKGGDPGPAGAATTAAEDARDQRQALDEVLAIYPETMTLEELTRELTVGSKDFSDQDRVQRAVLELTAAGLIHRHGDFVLPTRAAVSFFSILGDR